MSIIAGLQLPGFLAVFHFLLALLWVCSFIYKPARDISDQKRTYVVSGRLGILWLFIFFNQVCPSFILFLWFLIPYFFSFTFFLSSVLSFVFVFVTYQISLIWDDTTHHTHRDTGLNTRTTNTYSFWAPAFDTHTHTLSFTHTHGLLPERGFWFALSTNPSFMTVCLS